MVGTPWTIESLARFLTLRGRFFVILALQACLDASFASWYHRADWMGAITNAG